MVVADVADLKQIQNSAWQESMTLQMAEKMREHPGYKAELDGVEPSIIKKFAALDMANTEKVETKKIHKFVEMASMNEQVEAAVEVMNKRAEADGLNLAPWAIVVVRVC